MTVMIADSARAGRGSRPAARLWAAGAAGLAFAVGLGASEANAQRRFDPIFAPEPAFYPHMRRAYPPKARHRNSAKSKAAEASKKEPFGTIPKGPLHIVISIDKQRLWLYSNGERIAEAPVSTGMPGYPTPTGVFSIIQKARFHRSNIYDGAPMPFMQRLTWSGVALHAGQLPGYPASHGCIRLPADFATRLFALTRLGARVIVAHNEVAPTDIVHPVLFVRKERPLPPPPVVELPTGTVKVAEAVDAARVTDASGAGGEETDETAAAGIAGARAAAHAGEGSAAAQETAPARERNAAMAGELRPTIDGSFTPAAASADDPAKAIATRSTAVLATGALTPREPAPTDAAKDMAKPPKPPRRSGPIAVFVSRKEQKVFVRQGFEPLFDAPVTIRDPNEPFGTHVYTAMEFLEDAATLRWTAVSMPGEPELGRPAPRGKRIADVLRDRTRTKARPAPAPAPPPPQSAQVVLDRIELAAETIQRISELMSPGASLVISDYGLGYETGRGTDFIVVTR
jgi:lipoprotein-anchoring transpeptidase ErfK/SrfK